jgi:hypothetical protein
VILSIGMVTVIAGLVILDPTAHSVSAGYADNAVKFWRGEPLYNPEKFAGFLYLPIFAAAYLPFAALGLPVGDIIWRGATLGLLTYALLRVVRRLEPQSKILEILGLALLIALAGAAAAVRNGQSTTLLLAATLLAFDAAFDRADARAAAWATLAVIAKPLGIVVWLLIGGTTLAAIPWLIGFLSVALLAPYAIADAAYVNELYLEFAELMRNVSPGSRRWSDFTALFRTLDLSVSLEVIYAIRVIAAALTFVVVFSLTRRRDYLEAALLPATLACSYMLLFNPRAETNTYILMAVPFGLLAAHMLRETRQVAQGRAVATACVALGMQMNSVDYLLLSFALVVCGLSLLHGHATRPRSR